MKHTNLLTAIKGMIVGGTMLVPGVSGGSMAMILGIYTKLIHSVSSFTKHKKENLLFLAAFSAGGGFGMVLDGSERVDEILMAAIPWDTMIGVSRRSWGRCEHSIETVAEYNKIRNGEDYITMPYLANDELIERVCKDVVVEPHHHTHH